MEERLVSREEFVLCLRGSLAQSGLAIRATNRKMPKISWHYHDFLSRPESVARSELSNELSSNDCGRSNQQNQPQNARTIVEGLGELSRILYVSH